MLYHEVAIDPKLLLNHTVQIYLDTLFGLSKGRFVSAVPDDWCAKVQDHINKTQCELNKKNIKNLLLKKNRESTIINLRKSKINDDWKSEILRLHRQLQFDAIFSDFRKETPFYDVENISEYGDISDHQVGFQDISNKTSVTKIISYIKPFLLQNKQIVLVSPYQTLLTRKKSSELFKKLFGYWNANGGRDFSVISSKRHIKSNQFEDEKYRLNNFLKQQKYDGMFKLIAVNDKKPNQRLHERYLIGVFSGIELGYGLERSEKKQSWKAMANSTFSNMKDTYMLKDIRDQYVADEYLEFVYTGL